MNTTAQDLLDTVELIGELPAFAMLPRFARSLVAESFERETYPFGSTIVREGDEADAFYLIFSGSARVIKRGEHEEEIALNTLHRGDSFGEKGLLSGGARLATVRASGPVTVLRLPRAVFTGLVLFHPEVGEALQALAHERSLWNLLRTQSSFAALPPSALGELVAGLERVDAAPGEVVVFEGEPPGPMYIVEEGRLRAYRSEQGQQHDVEYLRKGDFFGERSLFLGERRGTSVEAIDACTLLRLPVTNFQKLSREHPEFHARLDERISQYDYRNRARVPLDFADEILPAEASVASSSSADASTPVGADEAVELTEGPPTEPPRRRRRFPHVFQLDEADCGAACLAIICRYFGRNVSITHIRQLVGTSTDGTTLAGITRGAGALGLVARSVRASKSRLDELPLPAVVHWQGNHWVVLYRVGSDRVHVSDPARGLRRIPRDEFLENWSGYASVIAYNEAFEQAPESKPSLAWLKPFLRPHRWPLIIAVVLAMIAAALELVLPLLTQVVVDHISRGADLQFLWIVFAAIVGVLIAITAASFLQRYLLSVVAVRFDISTLDFLTGRMLGLPMSYFATRRTGDIERRLSGARQVRQFVVQSGVRHSPRRLSSSRPSS